MIDALRAALVVSRSNVKLVERPDRLPTGLLGMLPWGMSIPGAIAASAFRYPNAAAVIDDAGWLSYRELWVRTDALAHALRTEGIDGRSRIGILARNHRGFVEWVLAASKLGAVVVLLNTDFAGPQLEEVIRSESIDLVLIDDEFADRFVSAHTEVRSESAIADMVARSAGKWVRPTRRVPPVILLTSGTTGRPKGARRDSTGTLQGTAALLGRVPLRLRDTTIIPAPAFHAWGFAHTMLALGTSSTVIFRRKFDADSTIAAVEQHRATVLAVVPVMLQRILALGPQRLARIDTSSLRVIVSGGSLLGARVATEAMNRFGPVLYNVYGSTEVSTASIATPADLLRSPTTAGRVAPGVRVRILDSAGEEVPPGVIGRVFVGNAAHFAGYTGGGRKEAIGGLLSSGDLGHFDQTGLLYIDGREDDMIVSGGENVFPGEVEELLSQHPDVAEVAVTAIEDEEFGQVMMAWVVLSSGSACMPDDLRSYVRTRLARFKVPKEVRIVEELPRTQSGKVMKRRLR